MSDIVRYIDGKWHVDVTDKVIEVAKMAGITPKWLISHYWQGKIVEPSDDIPTGAVLKYRWKNKRCYLTAYPLN